MLFNHGIRTIDPEENCPPVRDGFGSKLWLVLWLEGNQTIAREENCPLVRVRGWVRVSFGVGGQFSLGTIVLEPLIIFLLQRFVSSSNCKEKLVALN